MPRKAKRKTVLMISSALITAATTAFAVYAGAHLNASAPGSLLAQALPVGVSAVQQALLVAWSEFSHHLQDTSSV